MADGESMLSSQMSVQSLRRRKRTSSAALLPTWEEPLVGDHVFPHGLQHFETLLAHRTRQLFRSRRRPMISPKMSHQGLFGCVTPATLNTMKLHLLPMTLKMEVRHNPGSQDSATIFTGISSIPRVGPHILLEGSGIGKALAT